MSVLLQFQDICKSYGVRSLLNGASASFSKGQKVGVIGRNGAGKSTLCKILIGFEEQDRGVITANADLRLSYLEQHDPYDVKETVIDFLARYSGREEWECAEMAAKFQVDFDKQYVPIEKISGGYRTRVKLAAMLLKDPNFLILDEPTNYLDLSTLLILENFLQSFKGGFLIVSHDREFLKRTCEHTLEVENGRVSIYPGSIEEYFEFKEEQLSHKLAHNRTIEKKKEQLQGFVDRFKAKASKATAAKSKMKQIAKLKTVEIDHQLSTVKIIIPSVENKAGVALDTEDLEIGYPDVSVANKISMQIDRGEKIAILGDNGQGKTTFMRTIAGGLAPRDGRYQWGTGLSLAYYAQHVFQTLHDEDDVITHLTREAAEGVTQQEVLDMAGCFLFQGDDVRKKISVLSGGERARVVLAGLLLSKSQILLLDEPTNHLDFETVEALAVALKKYNGTVFFISHDRTFVSMVATNIIEVHEGKVVRYPGNYGDYIYSIASRANISFEDSSSDTGTSGEQQKRAKKGSKANGRQNSTDGSQEGTGEPKSLRIPERKKLISDIKKMKDKGSKLEVRLSNLTFERDKILEEMAKNPFFQKKERNEKLRQIVISLEDVEEEWYKVVAQIEKLEKRLET